MKTNIKALNQGILSFDYPPYSKNIHYLNIIKLHHNIIAQIKKSDGSYQAQYWTWLWAKSPYSVLKSKMKSQIFCVLELVFPLKPNLSDTSQGLSHSL